VDAEAQWAVKNELVAVEFAPEPGALESAVGTNRYEAGDALLTGSTGDRWCVSRARFDEKYLPLGRARQGEPGHYRNRPMPVRVKRMTQPFSVARSAGGDVLRGVPGDWLVEYAARDHGIVAAARFRSVYRITDAED
jgi:hypothetical protein